MYLGSLYLSLVGTTTTTLIVKVLFHMDMVITQTMPQAIAPKLLALAAVEISIFIFPQFHQLVDELFQLKIKFMLLMIYSHKIRLLLNSKIR